MVEVPLCMQLGSRRPVAFHKRFTSRGYISARYLHSLVQIELHARTMHVGSRIEHSVH